MTSLSNGNFFTAGLICGVIILVAIILLFLVRRINAAGLRNREQDQLKAYDMALEMKKGAVMDIKTRPVRGKSVVIEAKPLIIRNNSTPGTTEKVVAEQLTSLGTQIRTEPAPARPEPAKVNETVKSRDVPAQGEGLAMNQNQQPYSAPAESVKDEAALSSKSNELNANAAQLSVEVKEKKDEKKPDAAPKVEIQPEPENKEKKNAFDIFTDAAVVQSEISKFASKLDDVSMSDLSKQAADTVNAFKRQKKAS